MVSEDSFFDLQGLREQIEHALDGKPWEPEGDPKRIIAGYYLAKTDSILAAAIVLANHGSPPHPQILSIFSRVLLEQAAILWYVAELPAGAELAKRFVDYFAKGLLRRYENVLEILPVDAKGREKAREARREFFAEAQRSPVKERYWLPPEGTMKLLQEVDRHFRASKGTEKLAKFRALYENLSEAVHGGPADAAAYTSALLAPEADRPELIANAAKRNLNDLWMAATQCVIVGSSLWGVPVPEPPAPTKEA